MSDDLHRTRVCPADQPPNFLGWVVASYGRRGRVGSKNRKTTLGYPGLPGLPGVLTTPSLKFWGGEGGRARIGLGDPGKPGIVGGGLDE